jgi:hypothetical protein
MPQSLTPEIITAAIAGFELQKSQIDAKIAALRSMLPGSNSQTAPSEIAPPKRKRMNAAARRRIALAQKARWAKIRGESEPSTSVAESTSGPKRRLSEEGLKRIIAATKRRWALKRAEAAKAKSAKAKRVAGAQKKALGKRAAVKAPATKGAANKKASVGTSPAKTASVVSETA